MLNSEYKRKDNSMKDAILNWSKRRYSKGQRLIALIPACLLFLIGIPFALVILSPFRGWKNRLYQVRTTKLYAAYPCFLRVFPIDKSSSVH